jgi:hypothetical protein
MMSAALNAKHTSAKKLANPFFLTTIDVISTALRQHH